MAKPKEYYSEEVAIPAEAFKKFFDNFNREKRLLLLGLIFTILLVAASITALIAMPILMPAAFALSGGPGMVLLEIFLAEITFLFGLTTPFILGDMFYTKQASAQNKASNYKLSKKTKEDVEQAVFTNKKSLSGSLDQKLDQKLEMESNIIQTVKTLITDLQAEQKNLETQKTQLNLDVKQNLSNAKKLEVLSKKMEPLNAKKTVCDAHIALSQTALDQLVLKNGTTLEQYKMTLEQKSAIKQLSTVLANNKTQLITIGKNEATLEQFKKEQNKYPLLKDSFSQQITLLEKNIKQSREQLKTTLEQSNSLIRTVIAKLKEASENPEKNTIVAPIIKEMKSDLFSILNPILTTDFDTLTLQDKDYALSLISLCFEHIEKETTEHYSRLLTNDLSRQKTISTINHIIDNDASLNKSTKENLNYTLANHFFVQLSNNYNEESAEKACLYALRLDSSNPNNANFKEEVIRAAFFFEHEIPNDFPNEQIQTILANSHQQADAYQALKTLIENEPSYNQPVVLSKGLGAPNAVSQSQSPSLSNPQKSSTPKK